MNFKDIMDRIAGETVYVTLVFDEMENVGSLLVTVNGFTHAYDVSFDKANFGDYVQAFDYEFSKSSEQIERDVSFSGDQIYYKYIFYVLESEYFNGNN